MAEREQAGAITMALPQRAGDRECIERDYVPRHSTDDAIGKRAPSVRKAAICAAFSKSGVPRGLLVYFDGRNRHGSKVGCALDGIPDACKAYIPNDLLNTSRLMMNTRSLTLGLALSCCAGIVHAQTNVLPNGSFDGAQQVSGWTYVPVVAGDGAMTWNSDDANGNPNSGSLQIDYVQGGAALSACFAVTPAASFAFGGKSKFVSGSPRNLMVCTGYTDDTCSLGGQTVAFSGAAPLTWVQFQPSYPAGNVMPIGLNFVQCELSADRFIGSTGGAMRYDDLTFYSPAGTPVSLQSFNVE